MMMMCNDLMCTSPNSWLRGQLSLAHNARVQTDMPEKNENTVDAEGNDELTYERSDESDMSWWWAGRRPKLIAETERAVVDFQRGV